MNIPGLTDVLALIVRGIGAGAVLAFLFEHFDWFQRLVPKARWWLIFGASLGLPLIATLLLQFVPASVWLLLEPYWRALAAGFLTWAGSQVAHKLVTQRTYAAEITAHAANELLGYNPPPECDCLPDSPPPPHPPKATSGGGMRGHPWTPGAS